ncbi:MAG: hypothetical protein GQ534_07820, partial [Candidatus Delongbacteria bacterium]|nr:hypothetical protein [Candidatus Delongbacteria bacterium]
MNIKVFLTRLNEENIKLSESNNKVLISAPKGSVTEDIIKEIKDNKQELIKYLKKTKIWDSFISIEPVVKKEYYTLSSAQERIYLLHQMSVEKETISVFRCFSIMREISFKLIKDIFISLTKRHDSLRTTFDLVEDLPVQLIHSDENIDLEQYEIFSIEELEQIKSIFIRPFDLTKTPLLRVGYVKNTSSNENYLMVDMHHIISDGVSMDLLQNEFSK